MGVRPVVIRLILSAPPVSPCCVARPDPTLTACPLLQQSLLNLTSDLFLDRQRCFSGYHGCQWPIFLARMKEAFSYPTEQISAENYIGKCKSAPIPKDAVCGHTRRDWLQNKRVELQIRENQDGLQRMKVGTYASDHCQHTHSLTVSSPFHCDPHSAPTSRTAPTPGATRATLSTRTPRELVAVS